METDTFWLKPHYDDIRYWFRAMLIGIIARIILITLGVFKVYGSPLNFILSIEVFYFAMGAVIADALSYHMARKFRGFFENGRK